MLMSQELATTQVNSKQVSTTATAVSDSQQTTTTITSTLPEILQAHLQSDSSKNEDKQWRVDYIQVVTSQPEFEYAEGETSGHQQEPQQAALHGGQDGVVAISNGGGNNSTAAAVLLINPYALHSVTSEPAPVVSAQAVAVSSPTTITFPNSSTATALVGGGGGTNSHNSLTTVSSNSFTPGVLSQVTLHHHHNVSLRDMDVVPVNLLTPQNAPIVSAHTVAVTNPATITVPSSIGTVNSISTAANNASAGQNSIHHHQNVRDMDIVHVQWLLENYETVEGVSLPRSTLYNHYQSHCTQQCIEPVNAASFGKLIRSVFIGLRTRRLGTRGNSKYHYYGIRVKPGSSLSRLDNGGSSSSAPTTPDPAQPSAPKRPKLTLTTPGKATTTTVPENHQATLAATSPDVLQTHLVDPKAILSSVWPEEPTVPTDQDSDSPGVLATKFAACYRKHYEEIINCLGNLQFNQVEHIWQKFWQPDDKNVKNEESVTVGMSLTIDQLHQLTTTAQVPEETTVTSLAEWIIQTDYTLYNALISLLLLPNLLKPIPQQLTQQIRNFAKNITGWMTNSLTGYDQNFVALKVGAVGAFSHTLRIYTSLNHLSSAARAVLQNQQQVSQMITDLNRVDFKNVQEQASWVCQCDDDIVDQIELSFKDLLQQENPFDRWSVWCEQILDSCLQDNEVKSATQFFFKWGFYSSLVMRDLTLRSASSFGSFHLIRLLFDEYIFYLIEHRVAKATAKKPLQVLGEARSLRNQAGLSGEADLPQN